MDQSQLLAQLVELSNWLGAPEQDCAILGEGNTSALLDDSSFLVKASGTELRTLTASGLVEMDLRKCLDILEQEEIDDDHLRDAMNAAKRNANDERAPSVEAVVHAVCLALPDVQFVGHSHPTAINAIACSRNYPAAMDGRIFPDEVVVCGAETLLLPYVDPGITLARLIDVETREFVGRTGSAPKTIYLQNHGFIALGKSAKQVKAITAMAIKAARIRIGAMTSGGIQPMSAEDVERINSRSDEHYRQRIIERD